MILKYFKPSNHIIIVSVHKTFVAYVLRQQKQMYLISMLNNIQANFRDHVSRHMTVSLIYFFQDFNSKNYTYPEGWWQWIFLNKTYIFIMTLQLCPAQSLPTLWFIQWRFHFHISMLTLWVCAYTIALGEPHLYIISKDTTTVATDGTP